MNNINRSNRGFVGSTTLIGIAAFLVVSLILLLSILGWKDIPANYTVLKQHYQDGIKEESFPGGRTYFYNKFTETIIPLDMSGQVFVMNADSRSSHGSGRNADPLKVVSSDKQEIIFPVSLQWHRDANKLLKQYRQYPNDIEENLIRPNLIRIFTARAKIMLAIDLYSGQTQEDLRKAVEKDLQNPNDQLSEYGVIVDNFVIEKPNFTDGKYVEAIEARQRATINESRFLAEQKTNQAEADAAKIAALKKQYQDVVQAETVAKQKVIEQQAESDKNTIKAKADALNAITQQEAESKKIVLQAEADAKKTIALAEADARKQVALSESAKQSEVNRAVGILAVGESEANAQKLKLQAFSVPGSELFTRVEVAKSFAQAVDKVRFYPSNATFNTVASDFDKGLSLLVNGQGTVTSATK